MVKLYASYRPHNPIAEYITRAYAEASPNVAPTRLYPKKPTQPQLRAPITSKNVTMMSRTFINSPSFYLYYTLPQTIGGDYNKKSIVESIGE
jgi:hypothetical protein